MNEPIIYKRSTLVGQLALVQLLVPALVAIGMIFGIARFYDFEFAQNFRMLAVLVAILAPTVMQRQEIGDLTILPRWWSSAVSILLRWLLLLAILFAIGFATKTSGEFPRRVILTWALLTPLPLVVVGLALNEYIRGFMRSRSNARTAVIAGYNDASLELVKRIRSHREIGIFVKGYFDDRSADRLRLPPGKELLGGLADLAAYVHAQNIEVIFVALPMRQVQRVVDLLEELRDTTASIYYVPDVFVIDLIQSRTADILGIPIVAMCETPIHGSDGMVKRTMDVAISAIVLTLLAPLLLLIAILVKLSSPGPIIFKQRRYGLDGQVIDVLKFRTMTVTEDGARIQQATRDDSRVTAIGRFLRRYSLDELPQLLNVLQGSMSLVGPRPHAVAHNEEYRQLISGYMIRHKVLPGMTGLAQVSGCRGETNRLEDMRRRIEFDLEYLRHWSPALDLRILARTAAVLLTDRRAY